MGVVEQPESRQDRLEVQGFEHGMRILSSGTAAINQFGVFCRLSQFEGLPKHGCNASSVGKVD